MSTQISGNVMAISAMWDIDGKALDGFLFSASNGDTAGYPLVN